MSAGFDAAAGDFLVRCMCSVVLTCSVCVTVRSCMHVQQWNPFEMGSFWIAVFLTVR